jgi:hypothetical protein
MNQNEHESLKSYLSIAYSQVLKAQKEYQSKITQFDVRSLSYQILRALIMEQNQNEISGTTTR